MLAVISLGIAALTLNWFDVATAFPLIGAEFKVGLGSLSYLISRYIVGYCADRSRNLRMFIVGPLIVVAVLLALIPVVPASALWVLGIGIGFFLICGFAAWLAVPARVCDIEHEYVGTATGLMLTLAAVGGFFVPIIFGHIVPHTGFNAGWVFLAIVSFAFALLGLAGRNLATTAQRPGAGTPAPAQLRLGR